jgi:hypothetical protein
VLSLPGKRTNHEDDPPAIRRDAGVPWSSLVSELLGSQRV